MKQEDEEDEPTVKYCYNKYSFNSSFCFSKAQSFYENLLFRVPRTNKQTNTKCNELLKASNW